MKFIRTVLRYVLIGAVAIIIGVAGYTANANSLVGNKMPMPFGYGVSVVLTGSMEPAIYANDLVIVHESESYEPGDIVVYQTGSIAVVHRIISMDGDTAVTKGDANNVADEPISISQIKGRVIAVIPVLGAFFRILKTPYGFFGALALALILMEISFRSRKAADVRRSEDIKSEIRRLREELESSDNNP